MAFETLITTKELSLHLNDPGWVVIDCRFDMSDFNWGFGEYLKNHIPTAVYADANHDLADTVTSKTGRHPLPDQKSIISKFSVWGISKSSQVVVYDQSDGSIASRLWWLLRYYGHIKVAVLDGGFQKWIKENLPIRSTIEHHPPAAFEGNPHPGMVADIDLVKRVRLDPKWLVIDARAPERYLGFVETIDPVAGHIPGSVNYYFGDSLNPGSTYKDAIELQMEFSKFLEGRAPGRVVVCCGSGVTACSIILAFQHAGFNGIRLYPGSWSEWIRDPTNPIATDE